MTYEELWRPLAKIYDTNEAKAIVQMVLEMDFGLSKADILCGKITNLSADDQQKLQKICCRLLTGEPVQYVLGKAEFGGREFFVTPAVLIPRPETYELCQWIIEEQREVEGDSSILDIGTGSGCIACTLAAALPQATVTACDISEEALTVARENAKRTHVHVSFEQVDILRCPTFSDPLPPAPSLIVSNPPYICQQEASAMEPNVLEHEPHLALFVPDDDPLLFYRAIADFASKTLKKDGQLFFEVNPNYVSELLSMLTEKGFHHLQKRDDQFGKTRFIKATRS